MESRTEELTEENLYRTYLYRDPTHRHYKATLHFSGPVTGQRVLDVGGGDGSFATLLSKCSNEVHVLDISEVALSIARSKGVIVHRVNVSKEKFPFEEESFDMVFSLENLEHLSDPDHCMREIRRVLKRESPVVITTPNNYRGKVDHYHVNSWSFKTLGDYVRKFGFVVVKEAGCAIPGTNVFRVPVELVLTISARLPPLPRNWMLKALKS